MVEKLIPLKAKYIMDDNPDAVILDVRDLDEYLENGHIPYAQLIPLKELSERAEDELPDRDALIMVYCQSGVRSSKAAFLLDELGYTNVKDIGGLKDWPFEVEN